MHNVIVALDVQHVSVPLPWFIAGVAVSNVVGFYICLRLVWPPKPAPVKEEKK